MLTFDQVHLPGPAGRPTFSGLSLQLGRRRALLIAERTDLTAGFVNLIIGSRRPGSGSVRLEGRPSWPIGQSLIVRSSLTGRETVRFLSDLYNLDARACIADATRWFGADQMGRIMHLWPAMDRIKFERLAALWPEFDVLVVYGAGPTDDESFDSEWLVRFRSKLEGRGLLAVAPPLDPWAELCDITIVLRSEEAVCYSELTDALLAAKPAQAGELIDEPKRVEPTEDELF